MPLSSGSLPSLGGSNSEVMNSPSFISAARLSASVLPYLAAGSDRNMRPKRPSNKEDFAVDISPRKGLPWCECACSEKPEGVVFGEFISTSHWEIVGNPYEWMRQRNATEPRLIFRNLTRS